MRNLGKKSFFGELVGWRSIGLGYWISSFSSFCESVLYCVCVISP